MSIRTTIISQVQQIAKERGIEDKVLPVTDDLALTGSEFDSLMIAILVARLEDTLGLDPFTNSTETSYPVTLGEFIRFYENAATRSKTATAPNR